MRATAICAVLLVATVGAGCTNIERSRNLADAAVPGRVLALQVCSNCHGADGNSVSPNFPRLAGQTEAYLVEQLTSFRSHDRVDPAGFIYMWGISRHLTDEQIKGLASYFAAQKPAAVVYRSGDASLMEKGKAVFEGGVPAKKVSACSVCHGGEGQGNGPYPRIASQHADYLIKQLSTFQRAAKRPDGGVMKDIAHDLSSEEMAAVASYAEAIPPARK